MLKEHRQYRIRNGQNSHKNMLRRVVILPEFDHIVQSNVHNWSDEKKVVRNYTLSLKVRKMQRGFNTKRPYTVQSSFVWVPRNLFHHMIRQAHTGDTVLIKRREMIGIGPNHCRSCCGKNGQRRQKSKYIGPVGNIIRSRPGGGSKSAHGKQCHFQITLTWMYTVLWFFFSHKFLFIFLNIIIFGSNEQSKPVVEMPPPIEKVPVMPVLGEYLLISNSQSEEILD